MTTPAQRGLTGPPSPRQSEVLVLVGQGLTNQEIAERMGISPRTVKLQTDKMRAKFGVERKRDLIAVARMTKRQRDALLKKAQRLGKEQK